MKHLILTTAIILGAAVPAVAANTNSHSIQEMLNSESGSERFLARQLIKGAAAPTSGASVSSKSTPTSASHATSELVNSDEGGERFLGRQIANGNAVRTGFAGGQIDAHIVSEWLRSENGSERFAARQLIKSGAVAR